MMFAGVCVCARRYMVECRWYEQWKEFVESGDQNSSSFPGQIDNGELFDGCFHLPSSSLLLFISHFQIIFPGG